MYNIILYNLICMDQQTAFWILGVITAAIGYLYIDRDRTSKRIQAMENKMDMVLHTVAQINTKFDLFLKTEVDTLKDLARQIGANE